MDVFEAKFVHDFMKCHFVSHAKFRVELDVILGTILSNASEAFSSSACKCHKILLVGVLDELHAGLGLDFSNRVLNQKYLFIRCRR